MGSKTDAFETLVLQHVFNNTDIANIGDATGLRGSSAAGSLFIALCTSSTVASDSANGTAASYTGYARVAVARTTAGWVVAGNSASNNATVTFGECTAGSATIRYVEVWTAASGGTRLYWSQLNTDLNVSVGITPEFAAGALVFTED
jgi:hypothetical protein